MDDHESKVLSEFCHQLERSKQLFNGLRDLPQYGHNQWQSYFGKTFDVYTKLWKFQQQHRLVLDHKYGLKRWQIGEIASKIGQLYYHYYLRTSDTSYLHEAFAFYSAIRTRSYYSTKSASTTAVPATDANLKDDMRPELLVKKLRYYARFIVVCLLLKRLKLVRELMAELALLVDEHGAAGSVAAGARHHDDEHADWTRVLHEIGAFLAAESVVSVQDIDCNQLVLSQRLDAGSACSEERLSGRRVSSTPLLLGEPRLSLQEIIIVGNCATQVKFSELTIDMYRMLQTLEREPAEPTGSTAGVTTTSGSSLPSSGRTGGADGLSATLATTTLDNGGSTSSSGRRHNPHKYLLYRPTFSQLMAFLATGFKELPAAAVLLLYLSADGSFATPPPTNVDERYDYGGVVTDIRRGGSGGGEQTTAVSDGGGRNAHCLYPGDLVPFTRKPLFVIVDSDNAAVFRHLTSGGSGCGGNPFGQPLVVLMSPQYVPDALTSSLPPSATAAGTASASSSQTNGRLLTIFLHSPLLAACFVCNLAGVSVYTWQQCSRHVDQLTADVQRLMSAGLPADGAYGRVMADDFLRSLVLRHVFCRLVLSQHRHFRGDQHQPRELPPLPADQRLLANSKLVRATRQLFVLLDARHLLVAPPTTASDCTSAEADEETVVARASSPRSSSALAYSTSIANSSSAAATTITTTTNTITTAIEN